MKTPRGTIEPTFRGHPKEKNLISCIILAKKLTEKKNLNMLNSRISRKNFFAHAKKDCVWFSIVERGLPAPIFDNLPIYERLLRVRIFIWRQTSKYDLVQIYNSRNRSLNDVRVNILSTSTNETDLR